MNRNFIYTLLVIAIGIVLAAWLFFAPQQHDTGEQDDHAAENQTKGPQGGRLLQQDDFALELKIFEKGVPSEFHVYSYQDGRAINPKDVSVIIKLARLDGQIDTFNFRPQGEYLRGDGVVTEPHSFAVTIEARYGDADYAWQYDNFEGRVQITQDMAAVSGIKTEVVGAQTIRENLSLNGRVQVDPNRLSQVRARFPGVVTRVQRDVGDRVNQGDVLAKIQSNESLQHYTVKAPIDGVIISRDVQLGAATGDAPLFIIADLSTVWVELDVFDKDLNRVTVGQPVDIETLGGDAIAGTIDWLSPMLAHASQSVQARVVVANADNKLRPGQFVRGQITVAEFAVPLAVRKSGIQRFRDFQVVFARFDDTYEVRMLELGRSDSEWVEVLGGLKLGTEYVSENSYVIKADIEKSGASHDH